MNTKTRIALIAVAAVLVLVWGLGMGEGEKKGGYSDETNYYSAAELREREKVIAQMAEMRGETPPPTATPKPEKKEKAKEKKLDERFEHIQMEELPQSFTLKKAGYDAESGTMLAEFNMTGLVYAYYDVPQEEWDKLINAESFDKWFEAMIMNKYKFEQVN